MIPKEYKPFYLKYTILNEVNIDPFIKHKPTILLYLLIVSIVPLPGPFGS